MVIRTEARLKRVVVGKPAAIETVTTTPNEIVVTAKEAGSSSLVLVEETGETRIIEVFADLDVGALREAIRTSFPDEAIQAEAQEGKVVLTGTASTPGVAEQIGKMAAPFSKEIVNSLKVAPPERQKQVMLKVRFAEVDRIKLAQFGINLLSTGATNTIGTTGTQQFSPIGLGTESLLTSTIGAPLHGVTTQNTITDLMNIFVFRPDLNLGATIRDLQEHQVLEILAEPNLMALSGETAKFLAGGEFPYPLVTNAGALSTVSIVFKPYGIKLDFTGTIENDNTIQLKVAPEVSSLDYSNTVTISGFVLPSISTRRAETLVELRDGQSFGIAGLLDERVTNQLSKVPGIGDIPILGQLFRSKSINKSNNELLVLVTPTIVDPIAEPPAPPEPLQIPVKPLAPAEFDKKLPKN